MSKTPFNLSESPRVAIPVALVAVLRTLLDELGQMPDYRRAELERIIRSIQIMYRLPLAAVCGEFSSHDHQVMEDLANAPISDETIEFREAQAQRPGVGHEDRGVRDHGPGHRRR
jgi:hypothetical protein